MYSIVTTDPRWKHPFTCIITGLTGCGKTTFVARLVEPPPGKIIWCYGQWQPAYETLTRQVPHLLFEEGLPESSVCNSTTKNLVAIDDLMAETDARVTTLFTKKSHHPNTSVLYLVQNVFQKKKTQRKPHH